jgi:hypothetical protein
MDLRKLMDHAEIMVAASGVRTQEHFQVNVEN